MSKKILPVGDPIIKCFQFDAYPLSILANYTDYLPWFFSNYIQLYCNKDFAKEGALSLDFYEQMQAFRSPWLRTQALHWEALSKINLDIIKYFIEHINMNYYIYSIENEFYVPNRAYYRKSNFIHDIFIYGYDDVKEIFYIAGYDQNNIYSYTEITFIELKDAFINIDANIYTNSKNDVYFLKYNENTNYIFNFKFVKEQIYDYLYSCNTSERFCRYNNPLVDKIFGVSIYSCLKQYLELSADNKIRLDLRPFQILYEHKKCMLLRIKFLLKNLYISNNEPILEVYQKIENYSLLCRNLLIKYFILQDIKLLIEIKHLLEEIELVEKNILLSIIK